SGLERTFGIVRRVLRKLNPSLTEAARRGERDSPRGFALLPRDHLAVDPLPRLDSLAPRDRLADRRPALTHRVRAGETLPSTEARTNTAVASLLRANGMSDARRLRAGQILKTPSPAGATVAQAAPPSAPPQPEPRPRADSKADVESAAAARPRAAARAQAVTQAAAEVTTYELAQAETEVARTADAEPASETEAAQIGQQVVASEQSPLSADPSDYSVAEDLTIEVQAEETLGHFAEWLDLRTDRLRALNRMKPSSPVVTGRRL